MSPDEIQQSRPGVLARHCDVVENHFLEPGGVLLEQGAQAMVFDPDMIKAQFVEETEIDSAEAGVVVRQ